MIITIDGPAASGKGTISLSLAKNFGYAHVDSGSFYRLYPEVAARLLAADSRSAAMSLVQRFHEIDHGNLKGERHAKNAALFASDPAVRAIVSEAIKIAACAAELDCGGAVVDGRDIGTVVFPDAPAKLFVTASVAARAGRRFAEMRARGEDVTLEEIVADLAARDARDSQRSAAPLRAADDALLLDTSDLTIGQAVQRAVELVNSRTRGG